MCHITYPCNGPDAIRHSERAPVALKCDAPITCLQPVNIEIINYLEILSNAQANNYRNDLLLKPLLFLSLLTPRFSLYDLHFRRCRIKLSVVDKVTL
jgi:hypothetical protein